VWHGFSQGFRKRVPGSGRIMAALVLAVAFFFPGCAFFASSLQPKPLCAPLWARGFGELERTQRA